MRTVLSLVIAVLASSPLIAQSTAPATSEERLRHGLEQLVTIGVVEVPLESVLDDLQKQAKIPIRLDRKALADVGLKPTQVVTRGLQKKPLKEVLQRILNDIDCVWMIQEDAILVTTPEAAREILLRRQFSVRDLFENAGGEPTPSDYATLIDLYRAIRPDALAERTPQGSLRGSNGSLLASLPFDEMNDLERLLTQLRHGRELWKKWDGKTRLPKLTDGLPQLPGSLTEREAQIARALLSPVDWTFRQKPWREVLDEIHTRFKAPVFFNEKALANAGVQSDTPVTHRAKDVSLQAGLKDLLGGLGLRLRISDDELLACPADDYDGVFLWRFYPVFDLVPETFGQRIQSPLAPGDPRYAKAAAISPPANNPKLVSPSTSRETVADLSVLNALTGVRSEHPRFNNRVFAYHAPSRLLIVEGPWEVHQQVESALAQLRSTLPIPKKP